jgi:hypothetical protein
MAPTAACPSVLEEYFPMGQSPGPCSWHQNGGVSYPPEYQGWFFSQLREGNLNYAAVPLTIVNPRDNYTFLPSSGTGTHSIPVEVIGGSSDELSVDFSGETFTVSRPFVFFLPYRPGRHTLTVVCGGESDMVYFTAE